MVELRIMNQEEFEQWSQFSFQNFVHESAKAAGQDPDLFKAELGGPPTEVGKNDLWLVVRRNGAHFGFLWIQLQPDKKTAFGYDIYINEEFRSKGIGREAMLKCRDYLRGLDISRVEVCVYQHNHIARRLYSSIGFNEIAFDSSRGQYTLEMKI